MVCLEKMAAWEKDSAESYPCPELLSQILLYPRSNPNLQEFPNLELASLLESIWVNADSTDQTVVKMEAPGTLFDSMDNDFG